MGTYEEINFVFYEHVLFYTAAEYRVLILELDKQKNILHLGLMKHAYHI